MCTHAYHREIKITPADWRRPVASLSYLEDRSLCVAMQMCVGMRTKNIQHSLGSCLNKNSSCSRHLLRSGTKCFVCFTRLILTSALCGECSHYPHFTANRSTQLEAVQLELEPKQPGTRVWGRNDCCLRRVCLHQQDPIPRFPLRFLQSTSTSHILYTWALLIIP